eukprot:CAMPEP_0177662838 /NCGR_PEP_ID=MMETSP0447-20121125/19558_1 /TAXON_ID=0 /ORGANISM="Stygamoeba regulata, Strain BSH-02190019" /LENGTH=127 /DNA_ID=CAMNT_0019168539 /DNA_START=325 /DNA_END=708 /DNA_ORIENTATION=-
MSILQFIPLTATTSLRKSQRFEQSGAHSGESSEEEAERIAYLNNVLLEEDTGICESVQRGLSSRSYTRGRLVVTPEEKAASNTTAGAAPGMTGANVASGTESIGQSQPWASELALAQFHHLVAMAIE